VTWLHVARVPGLDGRGAWLVVPGIEDYLFAYAITTAYAPEPIRALGASRGWLVPLASEAALWGAIAATHGHGMVCMECLHGDVPCEAWVHLVTRRFEAARLADEARRRALDETYALPHRGWSTGPDHDPFARDRFAPSSRSRTNRTRERPTSYDPFPPPHRARRAAPPPPRPPPVPPPVSREDRIADAARLIGVAWPASRSEILKAFRGAALRAHPDTGGSDAAMREVLEARTTLLAALG
jgi:hypothetical protein